MLTGFYWTPSAETLDKDLRLLVETHANTVYIPHHALELVPLAELRQRGVQIYVGLELFCGGDVVGGISGQRACGR